MFQISLLHLQHQQLLRKGQLIQPPDHQLSQNKQHGPKVRTASKFAIATCDAGCLRFKSRVG